MPDPVPPSTGTAAPVSPESRGFLQRWAPGLATLLDYRRSWFVNDLIAGLVLTAILVPVGMGYAEASGLPAIHGLYATIVPLVAYAVFGPSRIMVLGPDSTLAAVIAAIVLPLSAHEPERMRWPLPARWRCCPGAALLLIGFARLGLMADLLSKPIRVGFMNAIALTVHHRAVAQAAGLFGQGRRPGGEDPQGLIQGIADGKHQCDGGHC
jgi:MFS superfamily sulfate permease-like transporter